MVNITIDHVVEAFRGLKNNQGHDPTPEDVATYIEGQTHLPIDVSEIADAISDAHNLGMI